MRKILLIGLALGTLLTGCVKDNPAILYREDILSSQIACNKATRDYELYLGLAVDSSKFNYKYAANVYSKKLKIAINNVINECRMNKYEALSLRELSNSL